LFEELYSYLFSNSPSENGCFLLANHTEINKNRDILLINKCIFPTSSSWNYSGEDCLEPNSSYINQAVVNADSEKNCLIFIHTHPSPFHPATFSIIDESSNKRLFANLADILPDTPLGSLVLSKKGIFGVIYYAGKVQPITHVRLSGKIIADFPVVGQIAPKKKSIDSTYDRQVRMFGEQKQKKLQDLTVTIVGAGGTGSSVATQLARMGVKKLRLIDYDLLDASNISRVYGANATDIGKPKVEVLKNNLQNFSKSSIETLNVDITKRNVLKKLIDSDIIFSCTDNLTSRAVLNDVSIQYFIPLIDVGCRIHLNKDNSIDQAVVKVQVVTPDTACLWCTGTLDGRLILQEALPEEEKKKLAAEGYYDGIEKQPSIISLTTLAASLGINKLLNILGIFGEEYESGSQIEVKDSFMINESPEIKANCICQKRRGQANHRRIYSEN
jgi:Dinucleotide-utilizing enzymes involved in molybdopterin and thiamine biosynthesis family 2